MFVNHLKLAALLASFVGRLQVATALPVEDVAAAAGFLPPPPGGLIETPPKYKPLSSFDYESLNLGLNQEFLELALFTFGLEKFSVQEFADAGLNASDVELIAFMAEQEVGHATMVANILGGEHIICLSVMLRI